MLSDTIDHARLAEEAEHALDASTINGVFIQKNGTTNKIEVVDGTKDIVEEKDSYSQRILMQTPSEVKSNNYSFRSNC